MTTHPDLVPQLFTQDLQRDERLIWTGQPDPGVTFTRADRFLIPFSMLWGGFALFWEGWVLYSLSQGETKSGNGGDLRFFAVVGLIMVAFGLYLIFGRFIAKAIHKRRTYYAVTNKRVLVLCALMRRRIEETPLDNISSIKKVEGPDGVGSLQFEVLRRSKGWFGNVATWFAARQQADYGNSGLDLLPGYRSSDWPLAFYDIHNVEEVNNLVNSLRGKRPAGD